MNTKSLQSLSDSELLEGARSRAAEERRVGLELLHYLREIEERRLHLERGYSSLFTFIREELKCSEAAAFQKIQALRLLRSVPEVEEKLKTGALTLTAASQIQSFTQAARKKEIEIPSPLKLIEEIEGKSKREAERVFASYAPEPARADRVRQLDPLHREYRFTVSEKLEANFERIKALRSHVNASPSMEELLLDMSELLLDQIDPQRKAKKKKKSEKAQAQAQAQADTEANAPLLYPGKEALSQAAIERAVWARDQGKCSYQDPLTGRRCGSRHRLELDHIIPKAQGGAYTLENLRLRCQGHNQLYAIQVYGWEKMGAYLSRPPG